MSVKRVVIKEKKYDNNNNILTCNNALYPLRKTELNIKTEKRKCFMTLNKKDLMVEVVLHAYSEIN